MSASSRSFEAFIQFKIQSSKCKHGIVYGQCGARRSDIHPIAARYLVFAFSILQFELRQTKRPKRQLATVVET
jgi:hypothetical protein